MIQADLGSGIRDFITSVDYRENRSRRNKRLIMDDRDCNKEGTEASERVERNRPATNKWNSMLLTSYDEIVTHSTQISEIPTMRKKVSLNSSTIYAVGRRIGKTSRLSYWLKQQLLDGSQHLRTHMTNDVAVLATPLLGSVVVALMR